jgi:cytochrome c6
MKNIVLLIALGLLGLILSLYSCSGDSGNSSSSVPVIPGESTFKKYCTACHGADGKMGLNGAANLTVTILSQEEAAQVIANGRKLMAPYKLILSAEEINEVAGYVLTLKE